MTFFKTLLASMLGFFASMLLIFVVLVAIVVAIISSAGRRETTISKPSVLAIRLSSPLPEYSDESPFNRLSSGTAVTVRTFLGALERVKKDGDIPGVLLTIDGFDGSWAQAEELRGKLMELHGAGKFVYAAGGLHGMDEKEYFIASAADSIIMNPASSLEMNGITATLEFVKPLLDRLEIKPEVIRAGAYKSAVEPFILDSASPANREMTTSLVTATFDRFLQVVTARRKLSMAELQGILNTQSLLTATEAQGARLVDAVMYEDQIRNLVRSRMHVKDSTDYPEVSLSDYVENVAQEADNQAKGEQIAIVYATGGISSGKSKFSPNPLFGGQMVGSESFIEAMRTARESKSVKAVVLRIDSPGGDADASEAMWREVELTRRTKPVIVSMAGLAASGGYFIAAAGDTIVAEPTTITGSIGVFSLHFPLEKFFRDKIGINTQLFETNPNADFFLRTSDAERAILARHIDTVYQHFMKVVADGRKLSIDSVNAIAQGRVWTGSQAQQVGLVDLLGGLDTAVSIAARRVGLKRGGYELRVLPREKTFVEEISGLFQDRVAGLFSRRSPVDEFRSTIEALGSRGGVQARMVEIKID